MELVKKNILTIQFEDDEVNNIINIFTKLEIESKKPGFKKTYNLNETELINNVVIKLKEEK